MARLMTAEEAVDEFGLPCTRSLRTMRQKGLPAVRIGKAYLYDRADIAAHIERSKVVCLAPIVELGSSGSRNAGAGTLSGSTPAASDSVRLAQQSANRLKTLSRGSH